MNVFDYLPKKILDILIEEFLLDSDISYIKELIGVYLADWGIRYNNNTINRAYKHIEKLANI